jgi:alanine-alpha-ketoisovalerate/valine-pyruvate aminotransferase
LSLCKAIFLDALVSAINLAHVIKTPTLNLTPGPGFLSRTQTEFTKNKECIRSKLQAKEQQEAAIRGINKTVNAFYFIPLTGN